MYRKKLTFSFFTIPVAVLSYSIHDWHSRRMFEKVKVTNSRTERIIEDPVDIQNFYDASNPKKFPWIGLDVKQLNEKFAFKPIELHGQFDHSRQIFVEKLKQGEEGFDVITPFHCYKDENGKLQPVLVNRGWIPYDYKDTHNHLVNSIGPLSIKGVVYNGDESHKYSKENDISAKNWHTLKPDEIATYLYLPNRDISSQFVIKQIEFNPVNKSSTPVILNVSELGHFPISTKTNCDYSLLWKSLTFLNIFSNMVVWIYL